MGFISTSLPYLSPARSGRPSELKEEANSFNGRTPRDDSTGEHAFGPVAAPYLANQETLAEQA